VVSLLYSNKTEEIKEKIQSKHDDLKNMIQVFKIDENYWEGSSTMELKVYFEKLELLEKYFRKLDLGDTHRKEKKNQSKC
jgi:ribosomal protein S24E